MVFSIEDYKKIERWLLSNSRKDTDFPDGATPLSGSELVTIVQEGENRKIPVKTFLDNIELLEKLDFINVTERYNVPPSTLIDAVASIPVDKRQIGVVTSFVDEEAHWQIYQFIGTDIEQWADPDKWRNIIYTPPEPEPIQHNLTLADEEDLTAQKVNETEELVTYKIKLKDKEFDVQEFSGMGRVWLRKNIESVNGTNSNVLTQEMINKPNTIYYIQYNYTIPEGVTINVPAYSTLAFVGGGIMGDGKITFDDTYLTGDVNIVVHLGAGANTLRNQKIYTSWFGLDADDFNYLTNPDNTIIVDLPVVFKAPITIKGDIDCTTGKISFNNVPEYTYPQLVTVDNSTGITNLVIANRSQNVKCGVRILQEDVSDILSYNISVSGLKIREADSKLVGISIENTDVSSKYILAKITGGISSILRTATSNEAEVIGLNIVTTEPESIRGALSSVIIVDNLYIDGVKNSIGAPNKEKVIGVNIQGYHENDDITINNLHIENVAGIGIVCNSPNIKVTNSTIILDSTSVSIPHVALEAIRVLSNNVLIDGVNVLMVGVNTTNGIHIKGLNTKIRNTTVKFDLALSSNMIILDNAKNFDISANLISKSTDQATVPAISSIGDSYGKLNIVCTIPGFTLINSSAVSGTLDLTARGEVKNLINIGASNINQNKGTVIHDCIINCDTFVTVPNPNTLLGLTLIDNKVTGKQLITTDTVLLYPKVIGNIFEMPLGQSFDQATNPIYFKGLGLGEILNNSFLFNTILNKPFLRIDQGNFVISNNNITGNNTDTYISIGNPVSGSDITFNELRGSPSPLNIEDGASKGVRLYSNIITVTSDSSFYDLNFDGTDKAYVSIV